ncbi:MAG TPA: serine/threonine-protein kinase [Burkholderiales bacterium]
MSDQEEFSRRKKVIDLASPATGAAASAPAGADAASTASEAGDDSGLSFEQLQAQLAQFRAATPDATTSGEPEEKTRKDPNAPKHRGILATDYDGPSYSELKRKAQQAGTDDNRLALPVGYMLHEYRIERVLGIGGFGVSYLAHDTNLNAKVAIKEYLPNDLAMRNEETAAVWAKSQRDEDEYRIGLDRFLLESRTLATFRHPNIVRVNRFFEDNNTAYMVMDYEFGESLNSWLKKRLERGENPPDEAHLVQMFVPLLQGLDKVHEAGFLHRDIKPANIYVRDSDGSLVLLDFGAARQTSASGSTSGMTSIVTPGYAPFEQYHTHGRQGPWSDIYALGGVLYWFVAGRKPVEAAARIQSDPQEPAADVAQGKYSENFLKAIDWALQPDDAKRPQSVQEFLPVFVGQNTVGMVHSGGAAAKAEKKSPLWMKLGLAAAVVVAVAAVALHFFKPASLFGGDALVMAVNPGAIRASEELQMRSSMAPLIKLASEAIGKPITMTLVSDFAPKEGKKPADIIMAVTDKIGYAARDYKYAPVGKFRNIHAYYLTKADSPINGLADLKGKTMAVYTRGSSVGPVSLHWLLLNNIKVDEITLKEFKDQDEMVDAVMEGKVDAAAVAESGQDSATKRYGAKIKQFSKSDPFPGYAIALSKDFPPDMAVKFTQALWKMDETQAGKEALDSVIVGSAAGSKEIKETTAREFINAAEQIDRARKLYPPAAPKKK